MTDGVRMNVVGIPEFSARLRALSMGMQQKIVRSGAMAAAVVFRNQARANAPTGRKTKGHSPGNLKKSVVAGRAKTRSKPGEEVYTVVVRAGKKKGNKSTAYYWRWVEAGHLVRTAGQKLKGGDKRRALERQRLKSAGANFVPPSSYIQRAFQSKQSEAIAAFNKRIEARIKEAQKELNVR